MSYSIWQILESYNDKIMGKRGSGIVDKRSLKVLSVDWDFFIKVSNSDRFMLFPDGGREDLPKEIKNIIWESLYGANREKLESIGVVNVLKRFKHDLLYSVKKHVPEKVVVRESHRFIYDEIVSFMESGKYSGVDLLNIDFHHDCFTSNDKVDCGNWLYHVMSKYDGVYKWLSRNDSFVSPEHFVGNLKRLKRYFTIQNEKYDLIYICRSDMWSPPHLDDKFLGLLSFFAAVPDNKIFLEESVLEHRNTRGELSSLIENKFKKG